MNHKNQKSQSASLKADKFIIKRRGFISNKIYRDGKVIEGEMREWLRNNAPTDEQKEFSLKAMRNDVEFIEAYEEKSIFEKRRASTKELEWIDDSRKLGANRGERLQVNYPQKCKIAEMLAALVLGFEEFSFDRKPEAETVKISLLKNIVAEAKSFYTKDEQYLRLEEKLKAFWIHGQRHLFLDSGTTTHVFAEDFLQHIRLPMENFGNNLDEQPVNKIEVITNDRHIFYRLGAPHVHAKTIIVGGRQQFRSATISGMMAERFLEANDLRAGMAIVATTAVCLLNNPGERSYLCAENEHVAAVKLQFLERADIRIAVADSSKFEPRAMHEDTRICSINNNEIDLVLTDSADEETIKHFKKLQVPLISYASIKTR